MSDSSLLAALRVALEAPAPDAIDVTLRPEQPQDLEFAADLYASTRAAELAAVPWPDAAKRDFLRQQFEAQHAWYSEHYAGAERLIVHSGAEPIGRLYLWPGAAEIRVMDIALLPPWCGRGIGTRLLHALTGLARERGHALTLHVEPHNPAQRLYARLGFTLDEQRGVYDFLRWQPEPA